jgi:hypothetical protein
MKILRFSIAASIGFVSMLLANSAFAQDGGDGEVTAKPISAAILIGYASENLKFGFGLRAGYTLPIKLYVGGTFIYHLGTSTPTPFGDASFSLFYPGAEVGYEIHAGPVWIRPYLGLGVAIARASFPAVAVLGATAGGSTSDANIAVFPGATLTYNLTSQFFVGGDLRFLIVSNNNSLGVFANGGMRF